ncbi:MAG TPA: hypothetical protein VFE36_07550 [Candidatus Baltobacteraceae bacterium]|jgi:hypothetical protein|nr:hypothetical protein [Candidatus Baltobacteraceae bacterium]
MSLRSLRISGSAALAALLLCFVCATVAHARSKPTPTPSPSPTPVADPAVTKIVRQQFVAWQAGNLNKSLYSPGVQGKLTDAMVNDVSKKLAALGPLIDTVYVGPFYTSDIPPDAHGYIYQMECHAGKVYLLTILDAKGKIATIFFKDKLTTETVEVPASSAPAPEPSPSP